MSDVTLSKLFLLQYQISVQVLTGESLMRVFQCMSVCVCVRARVWCMCLCVCVCFECVCVWCMSAPCTALIQLRAVSEQVGARRCFDIFSPPSLSCSEVGCYCW